VRQPRVNGHGDDCRQLPRQGRGRGSTWQAGNGGLRRDNPVRAPGLGAELGHLGQEPDEKARPFRRVDGKQIDDHAHIGLGEQSYDLGNARLLLGVADHHGIRKFRIIAFGIDDAELEARSRICSSSAVTMVDLPAPRTP